MADSVALREARQRVEAASASIAAYLLGTVPDDQVDAVLAAGLAMLDRALRSLAVEAAGAA